MRTKSLVVFRLEIIHDINDHFHNFKRNFENMMCVELPMPLKSCAAGRDVFRWGGSTAREGFGSLIKMGEWWHFYKCV